MSDEFHLVVADYLEENVRGPEAQRVVAMLRGESPEPVRREYLPSREIVYANQPELTCVGGACDGRRVSHDLEQDHILVHVEPRTPMYIGERRDLMAWQNEILAASYVRQYMAYDNVRYAYYLSTDVRKEDCIRLLLENYQRPEDPWRRR